MTDLRNKVALVTGSFGGIGRAIAERYASLGASVVINYLSDQTRARDTVAAIERVGATQSPYRLTSRNPPISIGYSLRRSTDSIAQTSS